MTDQNEVPNAVVLRFRDGRTEHVPGPPRIDMEGQTVSVRQSDSSPLEVPFGQLKAIFFLHDPEKEPLPDAVGSTLAVEFADGELIRGTTNQYNPAASGFYLIPHDRSKSDRVFVVNSAVVSIDVEKL